MKRSAKKSKKKEEAPFTHFTEQDKKDLKIAIYLRLSPKEDNIGGLSLIDQKTLILGYINQDIDFKNIKKTLFEYSDSPATGMDLKRDQLQNLLEDIEENKFDYIITASIDRLSQNLEDLQYLITKFEEVDAKFISINEKLNTQSNNGRFFISILGSLVQLELEKQSESLQNTIEQLIQEKSPVGAIPFGYLYSFVSDGVYTAYTRENAHIYKLPPIKVFDRSNDEIYPGDYVKYIFDWFISYNSISKVARRLNDLTIPIPRVIQEHIKIYQTKKENNQPLSKYILINKPGFWSRTTVRDILLNPFYTGIRVWNRFDKKTKLERANEDWIFLDNAHEKIIDEKTYILVTSLYEEIKKKPITHV